MDKIYFIRHQAGGVITKYPFANHPTEAQFAAVAKECFQNFGADHPKTKEPYWVRVEALPVLGGEVPEVAERVLTTASMAGVGEFYVSGRGTVTPKAG